MRSADKSSAALVLLGLMDLALFIVPPLTWHAGGIVRFLWFYLGQFIVYLAAVMIVFRNQRPGQQHLVILLFFSLLFRIILIFPTPYLSNDVYRYVWDGKVQAAGINPYRYIPGAPELGFLRDDKIFPHINRRNYAPTIYPPAAQGIFLLTYVLYPDSVRAMKAVIVGFDLITILALIRLLRWLGLGVHRVLIYAWSPLVIWEFAHSGHLDAVAIAFIMIAALWRLRHRLLLTGIFLGLATAVKLYPALLIPIFYKKGDWKMPLTALATMFITYLPYLGVGASVLGFLPSYIQEEGMATGERFFPLRLLRLFLSVPTGAYLSLAAAILGWIVFRSLLRQRDSESQFLANSIKLIGAFQLLITPRYPWYIAWMVPFLCVFPQAPWLYLSGACSLLYLLWQVEAYPDLPVWVGILQYAPVYVLLVKQSFKSPAR